MQSSQDKIQDAARMQFDLHTNKYGDSGRKFAVIEIEMPAVN